MTQEAEPRIDERPATHKKKLQTWLFVAFGLMILLLLVLTILNIVQKTSGSEQADTTQTPSEQRQDERRAARPSQADQFGNLVENRAPSRRDEPETVAAPRPADAFAQLQASGNARPEAQDAEGADAAPTESREERALRQWRAREKLRALNSVTAEWGFTAASGAAAGGGAREDIEAISRPLSREGSVDERRSEVRGRIEEAKRLRQKLLERSEGGAPPESGSADRAALQQLSAGFDEPPEKVVGYTEENSYNADVAGKMKLPPGTVIPAVIGQKVISDYDGSTIKALVTHDVYDISSEYVLIPKGTEVLMQVIRTQNVNEPIQARMGITVNKGVLPNGDVLDFSKASGMDREGVGAMKDQVDRHFMAQFLGVAAYALLSSETSREGSGISNDNSFAGDVGSATRQQSASLAQKYVNLVPTITIRPGQNFRIMLEESLYVEPWKDLYAQYVD